MSTLIEQLRKDVRELERKHGSGDPYVKDLKEQLRASEANAGKSTEEVYKMQATQFKPTLPDEPTREQFSTQEEFDEARAGWMHRVGKIKALGAKKTGA